MDLRLLVLVILASTAAVFGTDGETYRCPRMVAVNKYVRTHGNSCYQFITYERSWNSAQNDCRSRRGHLVTIRDRGTQDFIYRTLREFHWPGNGVWLGASDQQNEMDWKWVTNHRVKDGYSNWASGQPSCHIFCFEDCAQMRLDKGGEWHDYKCDWFEDYSYICEYPLLPKTTTTTSTTTSSSTSTTTTTVLTTTSTTTSTSSTTTTPLVNSTVNSTGVIVEQLPDVKVEIEGNSRRSKLEQPSESGPDTGSIVGLAVGLLCGLFFGLCIGVFIFRRRNKKQKEEVPKVFFSNPYYADVRMPLNPTQSPPTDDEGDNNCCMGGTSISQASTPVKRPLHVTPVPQRAGNVYHPTPTLAPSRGSTLAGGNHYDEITAQKLLYMAGGPYQDGQEDGAVGGVREDVDLIDHHYDYTTGENFYESMDNVRLAIVQNELNEQQEERYVPFQFDSPEPGERE